MKYITIRIPEKRDVRRLIRRCWFDAVCAIGVIAGMVIWASKPDGVNGWTIANAALLLLVCGIRIGARGTRHE